MDLIRPHKVVSSPMMSLPDRPCSTSVAKFFHRVSNEGITRSRSMSSKHSLARNEEQLSIARVHETWRTSSEPAFNFEATVTVPPWVMILHMLPRQAWQLRRDRVQEKQEPVVHIVLHVMHLIVGVATHIQISNTDGSIKLV